MTHSYRIVKENDIDTHIIAVNVSITHNKLLCFSLQEDDELENSHSLLILSKDDMSMVRAWTSTPLRVPSFPSFPFPLAPTPSCLRTAIHC